MIEGIILKGIGGFYYVDTAEGLIECKARGRFRKTVGKPIVGDRVTLEIQPEDGTGYLQTIALLANFEVRYAEFIQHCGMLCEGALQRQNSNCHFTCLALPSAMRFHSR